MSMDAIRRLISGHILSQMIAWTCAISSHVRDVNTIYFWGHTLQLVGSSPLPFSWQYLELVSEHHILSGLASSRLGTCQHIGVLLSQTHFQKGLKYPEPHHHHPLIIISSSQPSSPSTSVQLPCGPCTCSQQRPCAPGYNTCNTGDRPCFRPWRLCHRMGSLNTTHIRTLPSWVVVLSQHLAPSVLHLVALQHGHQAVAHALHLAAAQAGNVVAPQPLRGLSTDPLAQLSLDTHPVAPFSSLHTLQVYHPFACCTPSWTPGLDRTFHATDIQHTVTETIIQRAHSRHAKSVKNKETQ